MRSNETLTRAAIADAIHSRWTFRAESLTMVESIIDHICEALANGENVKISRLRNLPAARQGRARGPQSQDRRRGADHPTPGHDLPGEPDAEGSGGRTVSSFADLLGEPLPQFTDGKALDAMRTIGEVASALGIRQHVLRYWEEQFPQLKPVKRSGGRRYYRPRTCKADRRD